MRSYRDTGSQKILLKRRQLAEEQEENAVPKSLMTRQQYNARLEREHRSHPMREHNKLILRHLERFIKRNKSLLHLKLSSARINP